MYNIYKVCFKITAGSGLEQIGEESHINIPAESSESARAKFWALFKPCPAIRVGNTYWPLGSESSNLKVLTVTSDAAKKVDAKEIGLDKIELVTKAKVVKSKGIRRKK